MSRPVVIDVIERPSAKIDYILSAGKEGRERVRVVRTLARTFCCMTCLRVDCLHADVARERYDAHGAAPCSAAEAA